MSVRGVRASRAERMVAVAINPMNLIWIMPAQGNGVRACKMTSFPVE